MERVTDVKAVIRAGLKVFLSVESSTSADFMTADIVMASASGFAISIPLRDGFFMPLTVGTSIEGYFFSGSGRYFFNTAVKNRVFVKDQPVLVLGYPSMLLRTERREYYRIDTFFPIKVIVTELVGDGDLLHVETTEYDAHCVDISGGGIGLDPASSGIIPIKTTQEFEIDFCEALPGLRRVKAVGVRPPINVSSGWGIQFTKISDSDRDKIIRYVFRKQFNNKEISEKSKK